jgi:UPF0755 protein
LAAGLAGGGGFAGWHWLDQALNGPGPLPEAMAIVVPRGGTRQLAQVLAGDGIIARPWLFRAAALVTANQGALRAAEFLFPAHASLRQVIEILRTARPVQHHLTIPEGLTAHQIAAILSHAEAMAGDVPRIQEGTVLPQTYDYEYGADRAHLLARAVAAMDRALAAAWADRAADLPLASPRDALILASIVERETSKPEERPHVAAVYLNRLRAGMRLQADPTVAYAASGGTGVLDHPLTRGELDSSNPFNTYRFAGLPPAPICSPGLGTIRAVLHPSDSGDLYFVADGSGGHVFSRSYQAHDAAVARWRALGTSPSQAD